MALKCSELSGMGTTAVVALVIGDNAVIAHVGDSRAYFISSTIEQLTNDHSMVQAMVRNGEISAEEAKTHPRKNIITRAIGADTKVLCDYNIVLKTENTAILICTDGLTNLLDDQEILFEVVHGEDKALCCEHLIEIAKKRGAPDNVTSVLVTI